MSKIIFLFSLFLGLTILFIQQKANISQNTYKTQAAPATVDIQSIPLLSFLDVDQRNEVTNAIYVTANNDALTPSNFEIPHFKSIVLRINAVDKDYSFILKDFNIQVSIPQGKTTDVLISGMGIGEYVYECETRCQGNITVREIADEEDEI